MSLIICLLAQKSERGVLNKNSAIRHDGNQIKMSLGKPLRVICAPSERDAFDSEAKRKTDGVVRASMQLPDFVRHAERRQIIERILDARLFRTLITQRPTGVSGKHWDERLKRRRIALQPYLGMRLACVFVRLPGVHYTVEVDVKSGEVAYWEWQVA